MDRDEMTFNRMIHAAVRRDLGRLEAALASFPAGDRGRARDLDRAYGFLRSELTRHHQDEDTLIWPVCGELGLDPALLTAMEEEHHVMAEALADTSSALAALAATPEAAVAQAAHDSVRQTREVVDRHLDHEESELEPALEPHRETPQWKAVERQLRKHPLGVNGPFLAWLQDGMEPRTRAFLRSTIPPPVVAAIAGIFGRSYRRDVAPVWQHS